MGSKVQSDNYLPRYYSMRDLNHDSNGTSWPQYCGENHLPNGQYHYSVVPKPIDNLFPGFDKDLVKQTMLKHEAIFKNQVFELHRLYRVQKDLMDEAMRKEQYRQKAAYETSSSSSALPSQMPSEESQRHYSSSLLFANSSYGGGPPVSCPEINQSSPIGNLLKGKSVQASPTQLQKCSSPKHSAASETRPTKVRRKMPLDLQLPADEYIDVDEVEQGPASDHHGKAKYQEDGSRSASSMRKPIALADLNVPVESEEATVDPSGVPKLEYLAKSHGWSQDGLLNSRQGSLNGNTANLQSNSSKENELDWLSSLKAVGSKDGIRSVQQDSQPQKVGATSQSPQEVLFGNQHRLSGLFPQNLVKEDPWLGRASENFKVVERNHSINSCYNPEPILFSHHLNLPPSSPSSELANPLDYSAALWNKPSSCHSQKSISAYTTPFHCSARLSKSFQSTAQSNELSGNKQNMSFRTDRPLQNDHDGGSLSAYKESPPFPLSNVGYRNYMNSHYHGKSASGSSSDYLLKGTSSFDLNTTRDLNLNAVHPNGLLVSEQCTQPQAQASSKILDDRSKRQDPLPAFPWLRAKAVSPLNASVGAREAKEKSYSEHSQGLLRNATDCPNSIASTSCNFVDGGSWRDCSGDRPSNSKKILGVTIFQNPPSHEEEIHSGKRKSLFDINMPCDPSDHEFGSSKPAASANEDTFVERKIEATLARGLIDLNSCVEEDEVPMTPSVAEGTSTPGASSTKRVGRALIDLEAAPVDDLEVEDDQQVFGLGDQEAIETLHQLNLEGEPCDAEEDKMAHVAAEAIIALSSISLLQSHADEEVSRCVPVDEEELSTTEHLLHWFADIISTYPDGERGGCRSRESDDFELLTLRLTECGEEDYIPKSSAFDIPSVLEDPTPTPVLTGRPRRGPARRGRQRRDFQRDILPGLASLSRHEVTEDLQTFGGLMRATGYAWQCGSRRNGGRNGGGRGRRRSVVAIPPPPAPLAATPVIVSNPGPTTTPVITTVCATPAKQQQVRNGEIHFEGWGKATRKPRRQRCPPQSVGNPTSVPST